MSLLRSIESEGVNHSSAKRGFGGGGRGRSFESVDHRTAHRASSNFSSRQFKRRLRHLQKSTHTHTTQNHTKKAMSCCNNSLRVTTFIRNANTWETPQILNWKGKVQKRNNSLFLNIVPSRWKFITHMLSSFWSFYLLETSAAWKKKFDYKL